MPSTLLDWLVARYPQAKRQTLKRMIESRRVIVNGSPARTLKLELPADANVIVRDRDAVAEFPQRSPKPATLDIVFEDRDLLVVNKPAGLLTSTTPREK